MIVGPGCRQIDHDDAGLGTAAEIARPRQRSGHDACGQAEIGVVGDGQRLVIGSGADHAGDRREHLLAVDAPVIAGAGDHGGRHVVAVMRKRQPVAAAQHLAAFLAGDVHIVEIGGKLALADNRADLRALLQRVADGHGLGRRHQLFDEFVMHGVMHDQPRRGGAFLAGAAKGAVRGTGDGKVDIGVIHDDKGVLRSHFHLHPRHVADGGGGDAAAGLDRSGKGDGLDRRMRDKRIADGRTRPHHEVEQPGRKARIGDDLCQGDSRGRYQIRRFPDHGIAEGQRRRDLPDGRRGREIPRADHGDDTDRVAAHIDLDSGADRVRIVADLAQHLGGVIGKELSGAVDFAAALGARLAFLAAQKLAKLVGPVDQRVADLHQRRLPCLEAGRLPDLLRRGGGINGCFQLRGRGLRILADQVGNV